MYKIKFPYYFSFSCLSTMKHNFKWQEMYVICDI